MKKRVLLLALPILFAGLAVCPVQTEAAATSEQMYRLYNPNSGEHFYTASYDECFSLREKGWEYEGIGWYAPLEGEDVYRLYNPNAGDHHYTLSVKEKDGLVKLGWEYEGVGWKSDTAKGVPLLRSYNPNAIAGSHNYTIYQEEHDILIKAGWQDEEIGWYGVASIWTKDSAADFFENVMKKDYNAPFDNVDWENYSKDDVTVVKTGTTSITLKLPSPTKDGENNVFIYDLGNGTTEFHFFKDLEIVNGEPSEIAPTSKIYRVQNSDGVIFDAILDPKNTDTTVPRALIGTWTGSNGERDITYEIGTNTITVGGETYTVTSFGYKDGQYTINWDDSNTTGNSQPFIFSYVRGADASQDTISSGSVTFYRVK